MTSRSRPRSVCRTTACRSGAGGHSVGWQCCAAPRSATRSRPGWYRRICRLPRTSEELANLGLLQPAAQGRYHLHDLLRLFARDRLREEEPLADRVAVEIDLRRWVLGVTISAGRWFEPDYGRAPWLSPDPLVDLESSDRAQSWLREESEHWLIALHESAKVGEHQLVIDVAESLHWFSDWWVHWGHWHEVFSLAVQAARVLGDDHALATQLGYLSWAETYTRLLAEAGLSTPWRRARWRSGQATSSRWVKCFTPRRHPAFWVATPRRSQRSSRQTRARRGG